MSRHVVTDAEFNAIRSFLPKERSGKRGRPWASHRTVISGIFWILTTGAPWRDVPREFGKWQTVYKNDFDNGVFQVFGKRFGIG